MLLEMLREALGNQDKVGRLTGETSGTITSSYGFGIGTRGFTNNEGNPGSISDATGLTLTNAGATWNQASVNTLGAWDFGNTSQNPSLKFADYDGNSSIFACKNNPSGSTTDSTILIPYCESFLIGEARFNVTNNLTISWINSSSYYKISRSINGSPSQTVESITSTTDFDSRTLLNWSDDYIIGTNYSYTFEFCNSLTTCNIARTFSFLIIDRDSDGLIDIESLTKLYNIRYNTAGTSYKTSTHNTGLTGGCPNNVCRGYELIANLNFDKDGDGSTWTESSGVYSLDTDDATSYFSANSEGWQTIPSFSGIFEGNGFAINNLATISNGVSYMDVFNTLSALGLFGNLTASAEVRNLQITNALFKNNSTTGTMGCADGIKIRVLVLAGFECGQGYNPVNTGILAGISHGKVVNVITSGVVVAGAGKHHSVGGLIGLLQGSGSIIASYATGNVYGSAGVSDFVGGLVGSQISRSIITASYATGNVYGNAGDSDFVGGLVGWQSSGRITNSYATGNADGGSGVTDSAGVLLGTSQGGSRSFSYGFGTKTGERTNNIGNHTSISSATGLTLANAGASWNQASANTLGAWDFGNSSQNPALKFADYDGTNDTMLFACENDPASSTNNNTILISYCNLFLAGQNRTPVPRMSNIRLSASSINARTSLTTLGSFGYKQSFGRVEIYNHSTGEFGTVCDDNFDELEALVVCRELGFNRGTVLNNYQTLDGTGTILLDDVHCTGTESSLLECRHNGIGIHNCQHNEDVGVSCSY